MSRLTLLFYIFAFVLSVKVAALNPVEEKEALEYLLQFGYLQKPLEEPTDGFTEEEIIDATRSFQLASGLPVTGQVDEATLSQMRQPRCGVEDPFNERTLKYLLLGRWRKRHLTYRIYSHSEDLGAAATRTAIQKAFKYWSDVTRLTFQEVRTGRADIRLSFHGSSPWGCSQRFDGPGHVLAHADIPELGTVHFDSDEQWTEGTSRGVNLRIIATHEIGHALGLGHSRQPAALMAPTYSGFRPRFRLHPDDIAGIQALYGKKTIPTTATVTSPALTSASAVSWRPSKVPNPCKDGLDAIMLGPHDKTYAFRGDYVWTVTDFGTNPPMKISALWKGLPGWLDAAVHSPRTGRTYFFKGSKLWRYQGFKLESGYPKPLTRIPPKIDAAFYWPRNKKIFIFKGTGYWQWDELGLSHFTTIPKKISSLFTGAPSHLDAAFTWENGKLYFFKGESYWRLNDQLRVERGYPLNTAERWMHC
ncbi:matrix metalloproteinase-19 [Hemicordylus capensis]|uniref:matrix metalloproteinase-19 n=1 Tax=Hemicordylus capensis TaxID=884348 RepID=UPI002302F1F2|nr:matrix metalloproteinase-19 [Hemicordylus capensis]